MQPLLNLGSGGDGTVRDSNLGGTQLISAVAKTKDKCPFQ
jgi:hypothetical protein